MPRYVATGLAAIAACSSSSIPYSEYAAQTQAAQCKRDVRCGLFETQAACLAYFRVFPQPDLDQAIADHKVSYDGEAASDCVAALAKLSCDVTSKDYRVVPSCAGVLTGKVAGGDECAFPTECKSSSCTLGSNCATGTCCTGTCTAGPPSAAGGMCHVDADCAADLYCSALDQTCHALGQDGATCYVTSECDYGLGCVLATNPGQCHALAATGAACPNGCANEGETCSASSMTCVAVGVMGAPCTTGADCSKYEVCDTAAGTCADSPDLGQPCPAGKCEADAWCDAAGSGNCATLLTDSSPCDTDNDCASAFCEEGPAFDSCAEPLACD